MRSSTYRYAPKQSISETTHLLTFHHFKADRREASEGFSFFLDLFFIVVEQGEFCSIVLQCFSYCLCIADKDSGKINL